MTNSSDPKPRNDRDFILETAAFLESVQAIVWALSAQSDLQKLLADFDGFAGALSARVQGEFHPDKYLDYLEQHLEKRRQGILALIRTS